MGRLKRRLIMAGAVVMILAMSFLPTLFQGGSPPPPANAPGPPPATGSVRATGGGPAPAETTVRATGGVAEVEVRVRPDGTFRFDDLPEGTTRFEAACGPLRASSAGPPPVVIHLPGELDMAGRVVAADSGEPVGEALVRLGDRETRTDARGSFQFTTVAVPEGRPPVIRVSALGFRELVLRPLPDSAWDDLFLRLARGR